MIYRKKPSWPGGPINRTGMSAEQKTKAAHQKYLRD